MAMKPWTLRIESAEYERLAVLAKRLDRTPTYMARKIIQQYLDNIDDSEKSEQTQK